jgi:type I restriction enzyme R subunit
MTTGYDCSDILNICLMRPIFSPTDFIQIKGRGTRKHNFTELLYDEEMKSLVKNPEKTRFKLFDFFANCEYFEEKFNYDEVLKLPTIGSISGPGPEPPKPPAGYDYTKPDFLTVIEEEEIGYNGMKIDRMFFDQFEEKVGKDDFIREHIATGEWDRVIDYMNKNIFDKPQEYFTIGKLRKSVGVDRRITIREILEKIYGLIPYFKSKDQLIDEEFEKFIIDRKPDDPAHIVAMKYFFKAYATDSKIRDIIDNKRFIDLNVTPNFSIKDYKAIPPIWRNIIPNYIKDYISLNQFM